MRLLSVDFDYFLDCTADFREKYFPRTENLSADDTLIETAWDTACDLFPALGKTTLIPEYKTACDFIQRLKSGGTPVYRHMSHSDILPYLTNDVTEIVNVDFHHDMYFSSGIFPDCANWARLWTEARDTNLYSWVRRKDSDTKSIFGHPYYCETDDFQMLLSHSYDAVFLCLSPQWVPAQLWKYFWDIGK